jgi:flagellar assembly protein FliH
MTEPKKEPSKEEMSAYERWELPAFGGASPRTASSAGFISSTKTSAKPPTAGELEEIRKAAYQEGLEQGKRDGYKIGIEQGLKNGTAKGRTEGFETGKQEGQQQIDQVVKSLSSVMSQLADPISLQQQQITQAMTNVAIAIARSVIHRELHIDSAVIGELVTSTLAELPKAAADISISLNPADEAYVKDAVSQVGLAVTLVPSKQVHPGGCSVSTTTQLIDYTIEKRFQRTIHEMFMKLPQSSETAAMAESPSVIQEQSDYVPSVLDEVVSESEENEAKKQEDVPEVERATELENTDIEASQRLTSDEAGSDKAPAEINELPTENEPSSNNTKPKDSDT